MKRSKSAPVFLILALAVLVFWLKRNLPEEGKSTAQETNTSTAAALKELNRHPEKIVYASHALCRMQCRDITEAEIKTVLQTGKINYRKSDLQKSDCQKRYAIEDRVNDQHIRIIVAPCGDKLTVITCIDLEKEWHCTCE